MENDKKTEKQESLTATKPETRVAKKASNPIAEWLQSDTLRTQIAQALPKVCTPERFMRVLCTSMQKTPKLMQCTRESLFSSFITCSQLGIEPDGRRAYLIPYGTTCTLIIDYKGLVELALRSGKISNIFADVICENDIFEYDMGEIKTHKIDFRKPRGAMYAAYAICTFKDGTKQAAVMQKCEIEEVRKMSRSAGGTTWVDHYNEMAKKTVFKRLSKWLPLSPELRDAIDVDDKADFPQFDRDAREVKEANPFEKIDIPAQANEDVVDIDETK